MPQTHDFNEAIRARARSGPAFREALQCEAAECISNGDAPTAKLVLRDSINATAAATETTAE